MYAIFEACGKQYKVAQGDVVYLDKLDAAEDSKVKFDKVLMVGGEGGLKTGDPYVKGAKVEAKVLKNGKQKKIIVFTYKRRKNQKRKLGHRQPYTKIQIEAIKTKA